MRKLLTFALTLLMIISLVIPVSADGSKIPYDSSWKVELSSDIGGTKGKLFDNDPKTFWHSHYTVEGGKITKFEDCPHVIKIEFGKDMTVSGLIYTPRADSNSGTMREGNVYGTTDGKTYVKIAEFPLIPDAKRFEEQFCSWGNKSLKGIALEITKSYGGYASCGELTLIKDSTKKAENNVVKEGVLGVGEYGKGAKEVTFLNEWKVEVSSDIGGTKGKIFDGNDKTYWHSHYTTVDGKLDKYEKCPHTITITFPDKEKVSGLCYIPRQDAESGTMRTGNVYGSVDGTNFERLGGYALKSDAKRFDNQICSWGDKELKAIRLEITSSYGGFGTCAELVVLTGGEAGEVVTEAPKVEEEKYTVDNAVDRQGWKVTSSSEISPAGHIIDGKKKTYWHSKYYVENGKLTGHDKAPFYLDITLPELTEISEFVFLPRVDNHSGDILRMSFYASDSDEGEYVKLIENAEFKISDSGALGLLQNVRLSANVKVKRIRLEVLEGRGGYGSMAEFFVLKPLSTLESVKLSDYEKYAMENALYEINRDGFSVYYGGKNWNGNELPRAFDGYRNTIWQTETVKDGESVVVEVDMGKTYTLKEIHYLPRQSEDMHGLWLEAKIHTSMDGMDYKEVKHITFEKTLAEKIIVFEEEITARYIDIEIIKNNAQRVSATEIRFFESSKAREARLNKDKATYVLKIGSPVIEVIKGTGEVSNKALDVAPYIVNGSTLIPLRGLVEEMGAEIGWNGAKEKITISKDEVVINLQIWNDLVYVDDSRYGLLKYTLLNPPVITNNRTFIPVRFVSEILGYNVSWDGATQTVIITK